MTNILAEDYRHRIDWIEHRILEMADKNGQVLKKDVEAVIFQYFRCSARAVRGYLQTLEGARVITVNSSYLIVEARKQK